jgi:hypothetical protein
MLAAATDQCPNFQACGGRLIGQAVHCVDCSIKSRPLRRTHQYKPGDLENKLHELVRTARAKTSFDEQRAEVDELVGLSEARFLYVLTAECRLFRDNAFATSAESDTFMEDAFRWTKSNCPLLWRMLDTIMESKESTTISDEGDLSNAKVGRALKAWASLMRIRSQKSVKGLTEAVGLSLLLKGVPKAVFDYTVKNGFACSYQHCIDILDRREKSLGKQMLPRDAALLLAFDNVNMQVSAAEDGLNTIERMFNITLAIGVATTDVNHNLSKAAGPGLEEQTDPVKILQSEAQAAHLRRLFFGYAQSMLVRHEEKVQLIEFTWPLKGCSRALREAQTEQLSVFWSGATKCISFPYIDANESSIQGCMKVLDWLRLFCSLDEKSENVLRRLVMCYGDGLSTTRGLQCQRLRTTDQFGNLGVYLFGIGMFHFVWYALRINFHLMWHFGFSDLKTQLCKKRVEPECKKFINADSFLYLIWTAFLIYALDEFGQQRIELGLEDSWDGFWEFLLCTPKNFPTDELRRHWCEWFTHFGWWYICTRESIRRGDGDLQFTLLQTWLALFVWCGHHLYKYTLATYIYNYLFKWSEFWKDIIRRHASVHGKRKGHSIAWDHLNEIYVGLFKRVAGKGRPTHAVLTRISSNLSFLRGNWENLQHASEQGEDGRSKTKKAFYDELATCIEWFSDHSILCFCVDRKMDRVLGDRRPKDMTDSKLSYLHGDLCNRSMNYCYESFLPGFMRKMRLQEGRQAAREGGEDLPAEESEAEDEPDQKEDVGPADSIGLGALPGEHDPEADAGALDRDIIATLNFDSDED